MRFFWQVITRGMLGACAAFSVLMYAHPAFAASLLLTAPSVQVTTGDIVTVRVAVNADGHAINTAEGTLQFPADILQALSIDQSSSVFTIWVQTPSFSNATGDVDFSGGLPTPGFSGTNGTVLTVSFIAKHTGTATLSLSDADVRANDGLGTDVLQSTGTLQLTVESPPAVEPAPPTPKTTAPVAPPPTASTTAATSSAPTVPLEAPLLVNVTYTVPEGEGAEVTGTSIYPGATVALSLEGSDGQSTTYDAVVAQDGTFTLTSAASLLPGHYTGSVTVQMNGQQSPPSASFAITFEGVSFASRLIGLLRQTVSLVVLGIIFAFALGFIAGQRFFKVRYRMRVRGTIHDIDADIHKAFLTLKSRINTSLDELEKESKTHRLTDVDQHFVSDMADTIKDAEEEIEKDIRHPKA